MIEPVHYHSNYSVSLLWYSDATIAELRRWQRDVGQQSIQVKLGMRQFYKLPWELVDRMQELTMFGRTIFQLDK